MMFHRLLAALVVLAAPLAARTERPNIVVFMVDDLGWNHIGVPAATLGTAPDAYRTPHLRRLAASGLSFTHAYAQPNCAPTRAAMLSGQYPARIHNDVYVVGNLNRYGRGGVSRQQARFRGPEQTEDVAAEAVTVAEALQKNGYATAHIGKYHVGGHGGAETLPERSGFEINLGGGPQGHQPVCFASRKEGGWGFPKLGRGHFDRFAEPYDAAYLAKRGLPSSLEGTPKHVSDALGDALEETLAKLAAGDRPFYLQFHTYAVHGPVNARPDLLGQAKERASGKAEAEYLGFIAGVDENLGRLMAMLEDPDGDGDRGDSILEDTLVLFTSDNGGTHASNAPLRGEKGMFTEGGIRVPLIACWKGVVPAGAVSDRIVHSVDYYPTFLELAGGAWAPPEDAHPLDGESFAAALGEPDRGGRRGPLFFLFPGYLDKRAQPGVWVIADVDERRYKLGYEYESDRWQLFCLSDDPGEKTDLAAEHPAVVKKLATELGGWLDQEHPTWQPKYPIDRASGRPAGPPRLQGH